MITQEQHASIQKLSYSNRDFDDNMKCFATFGHHFNYNPAVCIANTYCVKGKPSMNADAMAGVVRRYYDDNGLKICGYIRIIELNENICKLGTRRRDEMDFDIPEHTYVFTIEDAKRRGFLRQNQYKTMPANMLHKRCLTGLLRAFYPEIIGVTYSPDELAESMIDDPKERDEIIYASVEGDKPPSINPKELPAPNVKPASNNESNNQDLIESDEDRPRPPLVVFKSVFKNAFQFKAEDLDETQLNKLAQEIMNKLFNTILDNDPLKHVQLGLNKFRSRAFQCTIMKLHEMNDRNMISDELKKKMHEYILNENPDSWFFYDQIK